MLRRTITAGLMGIAVGVLPPAEHLPAERLPGDAATYYCEGFRARELYRGLYAVALGGMQAGLPFETDDQKRIMLDAGVVATDVMRAGFRPAVSVAAYQPYVPGETEALRSGVTEGNAGYQAAIDGVVRAAREVEIASGRKLGDGAFSVVGYSPATREPGRPATPYDHLVTGTVGIVAVTVDGPRCALGVTDPR